MSDIAIRVTGLSKRYRIGLQKVRYRTLRETISDKFSRIARKEKAEKEFFWALKDIDFDVKKGDSLGVIGRNGAGKSTLLKILSRITKPTKGRVVLNGRVGSLLEVGTGFHPELTGRENVYLNGAILGMRRTEIERKFDEIVAFSEIEQFLDTPVKRYSSGMYVRLAFAVAAHLEPEVLIVDEVLAVGDTEFQKKCLGKMSDVASEGRTVLFVSHNMLAVRTLCKKTMLLEAGLIKSIGNTEDVVLKYLSELHKTPLFSLETRTDRSGDGRMRFTKFEAAEGSPSPNSAILGAPTRFNMHYRGKSPLKNVEVALGIYNSIGESLIWASNTTSNGVFKEIPESGIISIFFDKFPLMPGNYTINLYCSVSKKRADRVASAAEIEVFPGDYYGSGKIPTKNNAQVLIPNSWDYSAQ